MGQIFFFFLIYPFFEIYTRVEGIHLLSVNSLCSCNTTSAKKGANSAYGRLFTFVLRRRKKLKISREFCKCCQCVGCHLKCCYALRSFVGTIFSREFYKCQSVEYPLKCYLSEDYLHTRKPSWITVLPPSRYGDKSSEDDVWLPTWRGKETNGHTCSPLALWSTFSVCDCIIVGDPGVFSRECYNNSCKETTFWNLFCWRGHWTQILKGIVLSDVLVYVAITMHFWFGFSAIQFIRHHLETPFRLWCESLLVLFIG